MEYNGRLTIKKGNLYRVVSGGTVLGSCTLCGVIVTWDGGDGE